MKSKGRGAEGTSRRSVSLDLPDPYTNVKNAKGENMLHIACKVNHIKMVSLLFDVGIDIDNAMNSGRTALHCACANGNDEIVKMLLDRGCDVNSTDGHGNTALHDASLCGWLEIVRMLLEAGADATIENRDGKTAQQLTTDWKVANIFEAKNMHLM